MNAKFLNGISIRNGVDGVTWDLHILLLSLCICIKFRNLVAAGSKIKQTSFGLSVCGVHSNCLVFHLIDSITWFDKLVISCFFIIRYHNFASQKWTHFLLPKIKREKKQKQQSEIVRENIDRTKCFTQSFPKSICCIHNVNGARFPHSSKIPFVMAKIDFKAFHRVFFFCFLLFLLFFFYFFFSFLRNRKINITVPCLYVWVNQYQLEFY